jgi:AcrR family transcriptional regulator
MVRVAAEKGLETATVAEVLAMANVQKETFDSMFEGKEACFLEAYDAVVDFMLARTSAAFESASGLRWPERIGAALKALVELLANEAEIARMVMLEVPAAGGPARSQYAAAMDRLTPFLEEGRSSFEQSDGLPRDTARFAVGGASSMIFDEFRAGRGAELERIFPELLFAVLMPYLGPSAAQEEMRQVTQLRSG